MSALDDFVAQSATNYLQSVVFVDDKIYEREGGKPLEISPVTESIGGGLRSQFDKSPIETAASEPVSSEPEYQPADGVAVGKGDNAKEAAEIATPPYHPRELMESFAQMGIVCALYEPRKGFKTDSKSEVFHLCERADVVILDWDLYNDDGDAVSALLAELIKESQVARPHHVRLCALYTDKPSLHRVTDRLFDELKKRGCPVDVEPEKLRLVSGATRIAVFGKPVTVGRPEDDKPYEVQESDLAQRIISEFASLHHGLMPAFALHGLSAIRRNTKRLLDRFRSELDGAFLLHRSLVLGDGDAFEELPELLSDEIRAVLEDTWPDNAVLDPVTMATVDSIALTELNPSWKTQIGGQNYDARPAFRQMLLEGEKGLNEAREACNELKEFKKGNGFRGLKAAVLTDFEKMLLIDDRDPSEHLAALFCNRTQYEPDTRVLRFGTVVRHRPMAGGEWNFSVCLMPICDSQRLNKQSEFPFWKLRENAKQGLSGKRYGIVVIDPEGNTHSLAAGGKIRDMFWMATFTPAASGSVSAVHEANGFRFDQAEKVVEWVAELKPLHAQRIAAYMGSEVSRVGLVESEWLRLLCDR